MCSPDISLLSTRCSMFLTSSSADLNAWSIFMLNALPHGQASSMGLQRGWGAHFDQLTNLTLLLSKCPQVSESSSALVLQLWKWEGGGVTHHIHLSGPYYVPRTHNFHWLSQQHDNNDNNGIQKNIENDIDTIIKDSRNNNKNNKKWSDSFWKPLKTDTPFLLLSFPTWNSTVLQPFPTYLPFNQWANNLSRSCSAIVPPFFLKAPAECRWVSQ